MIHPRTNKLLIDNFLLVKYSKKNLNDIPSYVEHSTKVDLWNSTQDTMFSTMVSQLNFFYPKATVHVLTNERHKNLKKLIFHYRPELEPNHTAKFELYSLIDAPAMYLDTDIILVRNFARRHLTTSGPFNLFQLSSTRNLQTLCRKPLPAVADRQYNCGMIWIPRPSIAITEELKALKAEFFDEKDWIESNKAWFNNDEHPTSLLIAKYGLPIKQYNEVNSFRSKCKYTDIFNMQSIHYTGVRNKKLFVKEYKELCKARVRIFS
jgi:hypothetical protein